MALFTAIGTTLGVAIGTGAAAATLGGLAVVGAGAAAYGTARSISATKRAARATQAAAQTQVTMQRQQVARQRRQSIRANIIRRAQARAQAQAAGVETSSGFLGGRGSAISQLGTNLGYGSMMSGLGQQYTSLTGEASFQTSQAQMFGSIANLGMQGFQYALGQGPLSFGNQPRPTGGGGK